LLFCLCGCHLLVLLLMCTSLLIGVCYAPWLLPLLLLLPCCC
jgi:hypothetical protein